MTMMNNFPKKKLKIILKLILLLTLGFGMFWGWLLGSLMITFGSVHPGFYLSCFTFFLLGFFTLLTGALFSHRRTKRYACLAMLLPIVASGLFAAWNWWTVGRFPVVEQKVNWWDYSPANENSKLVDVTRPEEYQLDAADGYPRLDGAYALYPIYAAMFREMYPGHLARQYDILSTSGSDIIYQISIEFMRTVLKYWKPEDMSCSDSRVSPQFGDWKGMPPVFLFAGTDETMYPDTMDTAENMRKAGVRVGMLIGRHLFHVAPLHPIHVSDQYFEEITDFLYGKR